MKQNFFLLKKSLKLSKNSWEISKNNIKSENDLKETKWNRNKLSGKGLFIK